MNASVSLLAQRRLHFLAVLVGALAYWRLWFWVPPRVLAPLDAWLFHTADPFPQAIFLVAAALVYRKRKALRASMRGRGSWALAALPLLLGAALFVWGHYVAALDLVLVSFIFISIAVCLLWCGAPFVRILAIPCLAFAFAYPLPAVLTNQAFYVLRLWTAEQAVWLLQLVGVPAMREGNVIYAANVVVQIVDTCSGLRAVETLTIAAVFYVGWFPARRVRQLLVVLLAAPIAFFFNALRVCAIALAPTSELSTAHTLQGLSVFFGAISCLMIADRVLGRLLPSRPASDRASRRPQAERAAQPESEPESSGDAQAEGGAPRPSGSASPTCVLGAVSLVALAVAMLGVSLWMPRWQAPESRDFATSELPKDTELPNEIGGWTQDREVELDGGFYWTVQFPKFEYRIYQQDGDELSVFIGYDDLSDRNRSLLSRKNALPWRGWGVEERESVSIESVETRVERVVARSESGRILTYHWYEGIDGVAAETLRAMLGADQSPFRRSRPARVVRVAILLGSTSAAGAQQEARLRGFASAIAEMLRAQPLRPTPPVEQEPPGD